MGGYFLESKSFGGKLKVELYLSNYGTEADVKNETRVNTSKFGKMVIYLFLDIDKLKNVPNNLSNLKSKVDKLDNHKLVNVLIDLSKLSDLVKMMLLKRCIYY